MSREILPGAIVFQHAKELYKYSTEIMGLESNEAVVCLSIAIGLIIKDTLKNPDSLDTCINEVVSSVLIPLTE